MKRQADGSIFCQVDDIERKPFTEKEQEMYRKLIPKIPSPYYTLEEWKPIHSDVINEIVEDLCAVTETFSPPMRINIDMREFRRLIALWLYNSSDNTHKKYVPYDD